MGNFFKKLMPTREAHDLNVVADLDRMIADSVGIKIFGKVHRIKAMSQETFLKTVEAIAAIDHLRTSREVTRDKIIDGYTSVISACCDTIKRKDIERMTEPQIAGFLSQIIKQVQGEGHSSNGDEAVKKKLTA